MTDSERARRAHPSNSLILVAGLLIAIAAIAANLGYQSPASSSPTTDAGLSSSTAASAIGVRRSPHGGPLGVADGVVPHGATLFDDDVPGVGNLDPALLGAMRRAARDAADDGVQFVVNSGWRSAAYEEQLRRAAIAKYGSEQEAAKWVATSHTSAHVSGQAVDIGPAAAAAWLSRHGAPYGLCQIYRNEPWHYELRGEAIDHGCPPMYADPTRDPRMQR
jgi:zinc D-Ala-D-Ala carboxypeptidase